MKSNELLDLKLKEIIGVLGQAIENDGGTTREVTIKFVDEAGTPTVEATVKLEILEGGQK